MTWGQGLTGLAFLFTTGLVVLAWKVLGRDRRLEARLLELSDKPATPAGPSAAAGLVRSALPRVGSPLMPESERARGRLQNRLLQAGYLSPHALFLYLAVKTLLIFTPWLAGLAVGCAGLVPMHVALVAGATLGLVGLVGPSFWLRRQTARRQEVIRGALPDLLDVLIICLEAGTSLAEAFRRVAGELRIAHPVLGLELRIVQREIELGGTTGDALGRFADRSGLQELRSLAAVVRQTERLGGGLARSLRVHAEALRQRQTQQAEEQAHKASTKVLFPTLLLIFPGIFIIILGPAALQVMDLVGKMRPGGGSIPAVERSLKDRPVR